MKCGLVNQYEKTLSELTQLAYAAAVEPAKWQMFLDRASETCGGIGVHLFGHDDVTNSALGVMYGGYDPMHTESFDEYYGTINSWAPGMFQHKAGIVLHTELMCPEKELLKTEFYSGWCQPQEDLRTGGGVILYKEKSRMFALGGNIRKRDGNKLDHWWLKLLTDITPHMQQAIEISRAFNGMHLEKVSLAKTRSPLNAAVITVDRNFKVVYTNSEGRRMLEEGKIVRQSITGYFEFSSADQTRYFETQSMRLTQVSNPLPIAYAIANEDKGDFTCRVTRHVPEILGFNPIANFLKNAECYFLVTISPARSDSDIRQHLQSDFDVTNAEAEVAIAVGAGKSLTSIAEEYGKSIHTVRNQLKRAMAKLEISRQAELASYIERLKSLTE